MIEITESAAKRLKELIIESNGEYVGLRVFIEGGGCSGLKYCFRFEKEKGLTKDDTQFDICGINVIIDVLSSSYLKGAIIEHASNFGDQFTLKNPNFTNQCGCGNSFSV